ncbi:hypothetical protein [Methylobacterium trifolii]|uniref:Uncharacterized protein n=1 Tax=Methylobacterium trifolii TaxID=1003092 RepID=A0ABQ4U141_9HYPH|nr:hypothetical protein [Methylobacterium trifolii]GJE61171.1 hypothetical protein MPOCJGCO_3292 [Methylobacterium trifolii]
MSDLLPFPNRAGTPAGGSTYRAFRFDRSRTIRSSETIDVATDAAATKAVSLLANTHGIELWEGARFIIRFGPLDAPGLRPV